jgi:hypothetical protein
MNFSIASAYRSTAKPSAGSSNTLRLARDLAGRSFEHALMFDGIPSGCHHAITGEGGSLLAKAIAVSRLPNRPNSSFHTAKTQRRHCDRRERRTLA